MRRRVAMPIAVAAWAALTASTGCIAFSRRWASDPYLAPGVAVEVLLHTRLGDHFGADIGVGGGTMDDTTYGAASDDVSINGWTGRLLWYVPWKAGSPFAWRFGVGLVKMNLVGSIYTFLEEPWMRTVCFGAEYLVDDINVRRGIYVDLEHANAGLVPVSGGGGLDLAHVVSLRTGFFVTWW